jgi:large conductance mechanosensitive channel
MGLVKEFRDFAVKGNVIDLAVGVIIGAAFSKIINSLVEDIITPALLNPALDAAHLNDLAALTVPGTAIKYGNFLSTCLSFTMVALVLFLFIRGINRARSKQDKEPVKVSELSLQEKLLTEIRDSLKK